MLNFLNAYLLSLLIWGKGLQQQKFIFSQFWRLGVGDQGVGRLVSSEASLLGLQVVSFFPWFSLCTCIPGVSSSSYEDTSHNGLELYPTGLILT